MRKTALPNHQQELLDQGFQRALEQQHASRMSVPQIRYEGQQTQISQMLLMLDAAIDKAQPRTDLPGKLARLPIIRRGRVKRILIKLYNFLFKEQRTAQLGAFHTLHASIKFQQQLLEQTRQLEQQLLQAEAQLRQAENQVQEVTNHLLHTQEQLRQHDSQRSQLQARLQQNELQLQQQETEQIQQLRYLRADLSAQKRRLQQSTTTTSSPPQIVEPTAASTSIENHATDNALTAEFYTVFEDEMRGDRAIIRERLAKPYLPLLKEQNISPGDTIIDLGCGRGEWLDLLKENGYNAIGIDLNTAMVEQCRGYGLTVEQANALTYLKAQPDDSLGVITGFHIVEHLDFDDLISLMAEAFRTLRPGGFILFETPNPRNVSVGSCLFYLDPTHRNPLPAELLQFVARFTGFEQVQPIWVNPQPEQVHIQDDSEVAQHFNRAFYGFMDYAVMGVKQCASLP